ncbi:MAG: DNA-3-methyladenine glycosylase [Bacteroidales bacterium]
MRLPRSFYLRDDVVVIARELLGKYIVTTFDDRLTSAIITETEAYAGVFDRASHAFGGKCTPRTEVMFRQGGIAYIYLCYGMHSLFNIVTNKEGIPHAVLIRAIEPVDGIDVMEKRLGRNSSVKNFTNGPGKLAKALGIHYRQSGTDLCSDSAYRKESNTWIEERESIPINGQIRVTTRIGVQYAAEDALLPYRFLLDLIR